MTKIKQLIANTQGVDYFVGDIHGCYSALEKALEQRNFNQEIDRLISTGDLTDRGPESNRVFDFLDKPWFHPVIGNHEALAFQTAKIFLRSQKPYDIPLITENDENADIFLAYGGEWMLTATQAFMMELQDQYLKLPIAIEYISPQNELLAVVIHAEFGHNNHWSQIRADLLQIPNDYIFDLESKSRYQNQLEITAGNLMWARDKKKAAVDFGFPITDDFHSHGAPLVISGHSIVEPGCGPLKVRNNRFIDHGAYETGVVDLYSFGELV